MEVSILPMAQQLRLYSEEGFEPAPDGRMTLITPEPDARLEAALKRLFPAIPFASVAAVDSRFALHWENAYDEEDAPRHKDGVTARHEAPQDHAPVTADGDAARRTAKNAQSGEVLPQEGYCLRIRQSGAYLAAGDAPGLFYGLHTLRQLADQAAFLPAADIRDWPDTAMRCMNYDLRQTFSRPELLVSYLDMLASFKTNTLLIEYEDKFPFERYRKLRHPRHALTGEQLLKLQEAAERNFMEIIPLQQSFGHLEYILGRKEYKALRENEASTGELCPCHPGSFELVSGLLKEMALRHPGSRYLHLGCDEVYSLCECERCRSAFGQSRHKAFIAFVNRLIDYVCSLGKQPIIWHDMLADCPEEELRLLDRRVTVMIWQYNGNQIGSIVSGVAGRLRALGIPVIGAPAVRCFDRRDDQNYPVAEQRLANIDQWVQASAELGLAGLVGTNWTAVFSLGVPYGVFETTWYTMAYFADRCWNRSKAPGPAVLERFLHTFHGIPVCETRKRLGSFTDADYYSAIPALLDAMTNNRETARLIACMLEFETAADRSRTIHKYVYRWQLFEGNEAEWRSLMNNYRITRTGLERSRRHMKEALLAFQPEDMAEHYIMSRYYLHDYLDAALYGPMGLHIPRPSPAAGAAE